MKNKITRYIAGGLAAMMIGSLTGCTDKFGDYNTNPDQSSKVTPGMLATELILNVSLMYSEPGSSKGALKDDMLSKYIVWTEGNDIDWAFNKLGRFTFSDMEVLNNVEKMINFAPESQANSYRGVGNILRAYKFFNATMRVGDIPYSEAMKGEEDISYPVYDSQETVFAGILDELDEVVNEARAQIELALKHLPQLTHISGHMGSTGFAPEVRKALTALADEYHLVLVDRAATGYQFLTYEGTHATVAEKEAAFLKTLEKVQSGGRYMFLDHPGRNNEEMESVGHIGYEDVAADRQGVTELFTSPKVKQVLQERNIELVSYNEFAKGLPRAEASPRLKKAMDRYLKAVAKEQPDLHSIMVVQRGKVQAEHYLNGWHRQDRHTMYSVTKTFTAMAVGFAIQERLLNVSDKVISFFPDKLPTQVSERLAKLEIRHLLTMTSGFHTSPSNRIKQTDSIDWVRAFLTIPLEHDPGTAYTYSSMNSYMLSAIVQKVTGQKLIDYLYPRLFRPLGIAGFTWRESAQNICQGGWGLTIKTEDMAKLGLLILQKGRWKGKQLISEEWIDEMSSYKVDSRPVAQKPEDIKTPVKRNDWLQGYCYQMWRCTHNAVRADGANGQYILILPDKQAVITTTADVRDMQQELDLIWKYIYPAL